MDQAGKRWPSHQARRARNKQKLAAALGLARSRGNILAAVIADSSTAVDEDLVARLAAQIPCLQAQKLAACSGLPAHSSAGLVPTDTHALLDDTNLARLLLGRRQNKRARCKEAVQMRQEKRSTNINIA